ncbi:carbohydrate kinase family protein [Aquabacterium lacunae]|uniref:Carbohydrate kinase family protein n=1 Tax=Aquabacterium lacunae TaxID=2528630 RepID=A0A4Q9H320_9BURK|nr:carbohydrate kinase family protein [Aquabacterium lacunae]TBO34522.1 carbohydrate kinase family protein [Aquabacterium lacunae]
MAILICGSLAFDTITRFEGRFAQQILPEQVHILNVSFLVPTLKREYGGCAGNIAYSLQQLGGTPLVMATVGADGLPYVERMKGWGVPLDLVKQIDDSYTAQAIIITDSDNNQITAFHPGAMGQAHVQAVPARSDIELAIVAPDGRDAMIQHAEQLKTAGIPFVFDPGQGLPMFNGEELLRFVDQATWVAVNDYEGKMLADRTGLSLAEISQRANVKGLIETLGAEGCHVWTDGQAEHVPGLKAAAVVDPTGCGDAFRGGLLFGLSQGWPLARCVALGNQMGCAKIEQAGPQNYQVDRAAVLARV